MRLERAHRAAAVDLGELLRHGASVVVCAETVIAAPSTESLIECAKEGDKAAAKEVLALASAYLNTDTFGPMPVALRRYLGNALAKSSLGESADVTLNLKRNGRPREENRSKLRIAYWIYKAMQSGSSLEDACFDCQDFFEANIDAHGELFGYTRTPDSKSLERIYCEMLPDLKAIFKEVLDTKSTSET